MVDQLRQATEPREDLEALLAGLREELLGANPDSAEAVDAILDGIRAQLADAAGPGDN